MNAFPKHCRTRQFSLTTPLFAGVDLNLAVGEAYGYSSLCLEQCSIHWALVRSWLAV